MPGSSSSSSVTSAGQQAGGVPPAPSPSGRFYEPPIPSPSGRYYEARLAGEQQQIMYPRPVVTYSQMGGVPMLQQGSPLLPGMPPGLALSPGMSPIFSPSFWEASPAASRPRQHSGNYMENVHMPRRGQLNSIILGSGLGKAVMKRRNALLSLHSAEEGESKQRNASEGMPSNFNNGGSSRASFPLMQQASQQHAQGQQEQQQQEQQQQQELQQHPFQPAEPRQQQHQQQQAQHMQPPPQQQRQQAPMLPQQLSDSLDMRSHDGGWSLDRQLQQMPPHAGSPVMMPIMQNDNGNMYGQISPYFSPYGGQQPGVSFSGSPYQMGYEGRPLVPSNYLQSPGPGNEQGLPAELGTYPISPQQQYRLGGEGLAPVTPQQQLLLLQQQQQHRHHHHRHHQERQLVKPSTDFMAAGSLCRLQTGSGKGGKTAGAGEGEYAQPQLTSGARSAALPKKVDLSPTTAGSYAGTYLGMKRKAAGPSPRAGTVAGPPTQEFGGSMQDGDAVPGASKRPHHIELEETLAMLREENEKLKLESNHLRKMSDVKARLRSAGEVKLIKFLSAQNSRLRRGILESQELLSLENASKEDRMAMKGKCMQMVLEDDKAYVASLANGLEQEVSTLPTAMLDSSLLAQRTGEQKDDGGSPQAGDAAARPTSSPCERSPTNSVSDSTPQATEV